MASQLTSSLLQELPEIYQENPFLGQFLLAFEKILLGLKDDKTFPKTQGIVHQGIEASITQVPVLFDPKNTLEEFLSWLADWTAFSLQLEITQGQQRNFIANVIHRYRYRGTKANLERLLSIFVEADHKVTETETAHFFRVKLVLPVRFDNDRANLERQVAIARALIDLEKPAHTTYELEVVYPGTIQIGIRSTIGIDTLLGDIPAKATNSLQQQ